ncbi:MAG: BACON domain-containing protein, partial [Prevotellaceae bacterium]|nr:BACON domain-containing protein [Prevotellaceae bacterium]
MHKHFLIALLVGAGTLLAASCSEESAPVRQRTLEVVSSDTNFPVDGGSRTVTTARAATAAYAQDKWAQVRVENGQVIVKTDVNTDEQSRNTLLVVKDARGDSAAINVRQDGMIFRLPTSATVESDDQPLQRSFHVQFNVPVNITSSAPWIQVSHTPEGDVTFKVTANTSGRPRVGWLLSHAHGLTDSVRITQATLSDIVGTYRQHASTLDSSRTRMIDTTNVVTISKISDTKALFSIDGNLNWECEFRPGQGLYMNNGKVLREVKNPPQPSTYLVSLLAANDFRPGHLNSII